MLRKMLSRLRSAGPGPTYTMFAHGQFSLSMDPDRQCGEAGEAEFAYECDVSVDRLDSQGFVFDNAEVSRSIAEHFSRGVWHASCETLAGGLVRLMHARTGSRAVWIEASIRPVMPDGSDARRWMQCRWDRGCPLPAGPTRVRAGAVRTTGGSATNEKVFSAEPNPTGSGGVMRLS